MDAIFSSEMSDQLSPRFVVDKMRGIIEDVVNYLPFWLGHLRDESAIGLSKIPNSKSFLVCCDD